MNFFRKSFSDPSVYLEFLQVLSKEVNETFNQEQWRKALEGKYLFPKEDMPSLFAMGDAFIDFLVQEKTLSTDNKSKYRKNLSEINRQIKLTAQYIEDQKSPIFK